MPDLHAKLPVVPGAPDGKLRIKHTYLLKFRQCIQSRFKILVATETLQNFCQNDISHTADGYNTLFKSGDDVQFNYSVILRNWLHL